MMDTSATTTTPPMPQCKEKPPTGGRVVLVVGCEGTGHHFLDAIYHGLHANHLVPHVTSKKKHKKTTTLFLLLIFLF